MSLLTFKGQLTVESPTLPFRYLCNMDSSGVYLSY